MLRYAAIAILIVLLVTLVVPMAARLQRDEWLLNWAGTTIYEDGSFEMVEGYQVRYDGAVVISGCLPGGECAK